MRVLTRVVRRGALTGITLSALLLSPLLAWTLGMWIGYLIHGGTPPGEIYLNPR